MIIEIKDLPNNQLISKVDLHIDFQNGSVSVDTVPPTETPVVKTQKTEEKKVEIPQEMQDMSF